MIPIFNPLIKILLVEDNKGDVVIVREYLRYSGLNFELVNASTLKEAIILTTQNGFDVILLDLGLPDSLGLETLKKLHLSNLKAPVIVMTGLDDEETALFSLKEGAQDYLFKNNLNSQNIVHSIRYSIERKKIQELQKRNTFQFSVLASATASINESDDIDIIYRICCDCVKKLLDGPNVFILKHTGEINPSYSFREWFKSVIINDFKIIRPHEDTNRKAVQSFSHEVDDARNPEPGTRNPDDAINHEVMHSFSREVVDGISVQVYDLINELIFKNSDGRTIEIKKELDELLHRCCSTAVLEKIHRIPQFSEMYIQGFSRDEKKYGGIVIFPGRKLETDEMNLLGVIGNQASLSIHRRSIEKDLFNSEKRYRTLNKELEKRVSDRTKDLAKTNTLLEEELEVRIRLEQELIRSKNELEVRVQERTAELARSEERFHNMFYNHEAVMLLVHPDTGAIIEANDSAEKFYGYSFSQSEEYSIYDLNVLSRSEIDQKISEAIKRDNNYFIFPHKLASGEIRIVEVYSSPIEMSNERLLFSIIHDITERSSMEAAMKESEALYKALVNNSLDIVLISIAGVIEFANEVASQFLGMPQEQIIGKTLDELFQHSLVGMDRRSLRVMIADSVRQKTRFYGLEIQLQDLKGEGINYFLVRSNTIQYKGKEAIMSIFTDITENKNIEKYVLKRVIETEENDRKQFAADLHDDLGPLLSAIKLRLDLAENMKAGEELKENIAISNELTGVVVEKIRTISHNITPHLIESLGLDAGVRDLCKKIKELNKIDINLDSSIVAKRFAPAVELHFYRIISELINNSLKHSGASLINIDLTLRDNRLELLYFDNGRGYDTSESLQGSGGIGLRNILNRATLINASIEFGTRDGKTIVNVTKSLEDQDLGIIHN